MDMTGRDMPPRRLVVVRHGKSAWPLGVPDERRPLGPRGIGDAPRMGARIRDLVGRVDVAVVSPAQRTQQTWALLAEQIGPVGQVRTDRRVYDDWGAELMEVVRALPAGAGVALILGHEPGVSRLVLALADRRASELRTRVVTKFPTCAVAVLQADDDWADFRPGCATLSAFTTPRQ
jgi:phosphohistidine phosphatase